MTSTTTAGERGWRDRAACRGLDPELFFPLDDTAPALAEQIRVAKTVCSTCPVRQTCLDDAVLRMPYGIAGGLTATERHRIRGRHRVVTEAVVPEPAGLSRTEIRRAGMKALRAGRSVDEVTAGCRVSRRTVQRWASRLSPAAQTGQNVGEGSAAATAAPLVSQTNALVGTRITEGGRV